MFNCWTGIKIITKIQGEARFKEDFKWDYFFITLDSLL